MAIAAAILWVLAGVAICVLADLTVDLRLILDDLPPLPESKLRGALYITFWPVVAIAAIIGFLRSDYK
jgi:hypothetical protein